MTAENPPAEEDLVPMGRISGLYGVKGWVKVFSYTDPREAILDFDRWWLNKSGSWQPVAVSDGRRHGKAVIASLGDCHDRDAAAGLLDVDIAVPRSALPEPAENSFYWADLEGLGVVNTKGETLGRVAYLLETGAHDVMVVQGDTERLIPFVLHDTVREVDLGKGLITVDWDWD